MPARRLAAALGTGLPRGRARRVGPFVGIAATLAAAKVILATVAVTLFVSEEGAAGLPFFYVTFAPFAILLSFALGGIIDRAPRVRLAQILFAVLLIGTCGLRLLPVLGQDGTGFALLAAATVLEIVVDVVFWVVVAAYLDAFELRRATAVLYMGLAAGGALGGIAVRVGLGALAPADILFLLLPLAVLVVIQLQAVSRRLDEVPENHHHLSEPAPGLAGVMQVLRLLGRYPLALLIALNALVVTLLYGLAEFLILSIYEDRFQSETELASFLAVLFAVMQVVEFALLLSLTRLLLERAGPLLRNLVFPATSLAALGSLLVEPRLATAVAAHVNAEAASNALFLPVHNANYIALPLGFQGRARTLSEGVFYPLGLALAGAILWGADAGSPLLQAEFATAVFVLVFLLVSAGAGLLFLPTLLVHARAHLTAPPPGTSAGEPSLMQVRSLLRNRDPALCQLGLSIAGTLDPVTVEDELRLLSDRPVPAIRRPLARVIANAPTVWRAEHVAACLQQRTGEAQKLGLLVMLIRGDLPSLEQMRAVREARDPVVIALGRLAVDGRQADLAPWAADAAVASELAEVVAASGRSDLALHLLVSLDEVAPDQLGRLLTLVDDGGVREEAEAIVRRLLRHPDGAVRAEAVRAGDRLDGTARWLRPLADALRDPDRRVRAAAGAALVRHGDRAVALVRAALGAVTPATAEAVAVIARIGTPRARRLLARTVRALRADAERTDRMLRSIAGAATASGWTALEIALRDHRRRLAEIALSAILATVDPPLARHLRHAFASSDQRHRARAFELLDARRATQRLPDAIDLLRHLSFEDAPPGRAVAGGAADRRRDLREEAAASSGPWVRLAGSFNAGGGRHRSRVSGAMAGGVETMATSDRDVERIILLKRIPLFRDLDLDALREVARDVAVRSWLPGDEVVAAGSARHGLLVLEAGTLQIGDERVVAPASFGEVTLAGQGIVWPRIAALEESRVGFLGTLLFEELQRDHPELALRLATILARRVRELETGAAGGRGSERPFAEIGNDAAE